MNDLSVAIAIGRHLDTLLTPSPETTESATPQDAITAPSSVPEFGMGLQTGTTGTVSPAAEISMHDSNFNSEPLSVAQFEPLPDLDVFDSDVFNDFDSFIATMGMNGPFELDLFTGGPNHEPTPAPNGRTEMLMLHGHPNAPQQHDSYQCQDAARGAKSMEFADADADELKELRPMPCPWGFSTAQREELQRISSVYRNEEEAYQVPSRLALGRYIAAYFDELHNHFPMIHASTLRPQTICTSAPELVLALATCGAACKYETRTALRTWHVATRITLAKWRQASVATSEEKLRTAQAALLLTDFALLHYNCKTMQNSPELREILQDFARDRRAIEHSEQHDWQRWILAEGQRRTVCCIYVVLHLFSTALDVPPSLLVSELDVELPSSTAEWTAPSQSAWLQARKSGTSVTHVQQALAALFSATTPQGLHSPLSNLVLMVAVLQRVYLGRQMQLVGDQGPVRDGDASEIQSALQRWTLAWQQARESMLDPRNPDGSNSFTSTSYLGLAYIRLCTNYASRRHLTSWDVAKFGRSLHESPLPQRSSSLAPALLHATQALYIPVKLGLEWITRSNFLHWDLSIFLCYLEAAVFTSKWLLSIAESSGHFPLTDCELNILKTLHRISDEIDESLDPITDVVEMQTVRVASEVGTTALARSLAIRIADIWARLFSHHNSPWPMVDLIGRSLAEYARLVREHTQMK
ncbi:hypothetical protein CBER1_01527 [Cercospora berteroae]|uniref:Xylanolytic transcriptional activator regulatory domain-containing protein n=1 Tax=Cercospora berteroae TaxID=357750 RepID=A0A2S6C5P0_9PEZI|nr:hypothetical protein CBER1_01527 [Cercospora berteroae]